jgi:hypothetical protein
MFCSHHLIPHESCAGCQATLSAMRPTVFAELAAAELSAGIDCCDRCGYIFCEPSVRCFQCGTHRALLTEFDDASTMPIGLPLAIEADLIELDTASWDKQR